MRSSGAILRKDEQEEHHSGLKVPEREERHTELEVPEQEEHKEELRHTLIYGLTATAKPYKPHKQLLHFAAMHIQ